MTATFATSVFVTLGVLVLGLFAFYFRQFYHAQADAMKALRGATTDKDSCMARLASAHDVLGLLNVVFSAIAVGLLGTGIAAFAAVNLNSMTLELRQLNNSIGNHILQTSEVSGSIREMQSELTTIRNDLRAVTDDVAVLLATHDLAPAGIAANNAANQRIPELTVDEELADEFFALYRPPILPMIRRVESDTENNPPAFDGGSVGLQLSNEYFTSVTVSAAYAGTITDASYDEEMTEPRRYQIVVTHPDDYQTHYGLISNLAPRFAALIGDVDDPDAEPNFTALLELELTVATQEPLGTSDSASPIWTRFALIAPDGTPINPLTAIRGFSYSRDVIVSKKRVLPEE